MTEKVINNINIKDMQLVRKGKCEPNKCKSACCKFYMVSRTGDVDDYIEGFFEKTNKYGDHYIIRNCKHLDVKNNKCKVWGTDRCPKVCRIFPNSIDAVYKQVFDVCTFRFELQPAEVPAGIKEIKLAEPREIIK